MGKREGVGFDFLDALPEDGERRLMLAALIDAIRILTAHAPAAPLAAHRAWARERNWMQANEYRHPFSFVSICNSLGLDPDYVRRCVFSRDRTEPPPARTRRYAAKVAESWGQLRKPRGLSQRPGSGGGATHTLLGSSAAAHVAVADRPPPHCVSVVHYGT